MAVGSTIDASAGDGKHTSNNPKLRSGLNRKGSLRSHTRRVEHPSARSNSRLISSAIAPGTKRQCENTRNLAGSRTEPSAALKMPSLQYLYVGAHQRNRQRSTLAVASGPDKRSRRLRNLRF